MDLQDHVVLRCRDHRVLRRLLKSSGEHRLTSRVEAFGDLVFGFSLSLLATRLDVPSRVEDIFEPTRWLAVITTFGLICRFWFEHYRTFRHHFVVSAFHMVVNFVFLFGIAVLPYSVQTYLRFKMALLPFTLYVGDLCLILIALSILRVRGLRQRRYDAEDERRLSDRRRSLAQIAIAACLMVLLLVLQRSGGNFQREMRAFAVYITSAILLILTAVRHGVRELPSFLRQTQTRAG